MWHFRIKIEPQCQNSLQNPELLFNANSEMFKLYIYIYNNLIFNEVMNISSNFLKKNELKVTNMGRV